MFIWLIAHNVNLSGQINVIYPSRLCIYDGIVQTCYTTRWNIENHNILIIFSFCFLLSLSHPNIHPTEHFLTELLVITDIGKIWRGIVAQSVIMDIGAEKIMDQVFTTSDQEMWKKCILYISYKIRDQEIWFVNQSSWKVALLQLWKLALLKLGIREFVLRNVGYGQHWIHIHTLPQNATFQVSRFIENSSCKTAFEEALLESRDI